MSNKRIMVVDDDNSLLDIVSIILEQRGFETIPLNTGQNLIEKVKEFKPEVILLDVQLGTMDGRMLCKQIKEMEEHTTTPIILFSANIYYAKTVKEYLCNDFIKKPFEITSLIDMINKHMNISN